GFTLIELLVVIAIIGLLASVIMASLNSARVGARDAKRAADMRQVQLALEFYFDEEGYYPLIESEYLSGLAVYLAPYIPTIPEDPLYGGTESDYLYNTSDVYNGYTILRWDEESNDWCRITHGNGN